MEKSGKSGKQISKITKSKNPLTKEVAKQVKKLNEKIIKMESGAEVVQLRTSEVTHFKKHIFEDMKEQANYLTNKQLKEKLSKTSFFNKKWTHHQTVKYIEDEYNILRRQGKIGTNIVKIKGDTVIICINENGTFKTAYGSYKYQVNDFR